MNRGKNVHPEHLWSAVRAVNTTPIEPGLEKENLDWIMMQRLRATCIPSPARFVILTMSRLTNMDERNYYGGLELIEQITMYSERAVREHLAILRDSGLVESKIEHGQLYKRNMRQNYFIHIPPGDIITCAEWEIHNQTASHIKNFPKVVKMLERNSNVGMDEPREN